MKFSGILLTVLIGIAFMIEACGPETILLRPSLDTPAHHVENGYKLMAYGKIDAAMQEFSRAKELNETYAPAYVGLGIACGKKGQLAEGRAFMKKAQKLARNAEEHKEVEMGYEGLDFIEKENAQ
jgi:tetratricopeptide (TPR) repeat protein